MQGLESTSKSEIVPPTHLGVSNSLRHRKSLEEKRQTERRMMMLLPLGSTRREIIQRRRSWVRYACYADDGRTDVFTELSVTQRAEQRLDMRRCDARGERRDGGEGGGQSRERVGVSFAQSRSNGSKTFRQQVKRVEVL